MFKALGLIPSTEKEGETNKQAGRQTETHTHRDIHTDTDSDRQTETGTHERETEKEREREREREGFPSTGFVDLQSSHSSQLWGPMP